MAVTTINRDDLGAGPQKLVKSGDFKNKRLDDIQGKDVRYEDCDFSYGIIERGYFHKAKFLRCKFIGTRFVDSVFRSATFESCEFSYADFDRCELPISQLLANLPAYPNVRWELLHKLRANARSVGDIQNEPDIVWQEINTEIAHWRAIYENQSGYYNKYSFLDRIKARLQHGRLMVERYVWGHGESLLRLGVATLAFLFLLAFIRATHTANFESETIVSFAKNLASSFLFIVYLYIDLPMPDVTAVAASESAVTSALAVVLRYVTIGLAVPILYKYIAKR